MKVGIFADALDRNNTGISQYVRQLIMHLKQRHDLTVVHVRNSDDPVYEGVREIIIPRLFSSPGLARLYANLFLRNLDVDIFHYPSPIGSFLFPMNVKVVNTVHDLVPFKLPETRTFVNRMIYKIFLKPSLKNADAIVSVSECTKRDTCSILRIPEKKVHVILEASSYKRPSASETSRVLKQHNISYPYFLFVGTIEPRKNLVRALKAFAQAGLRSHHFIFAGSFGWKYDGVFKTIEQFGLKDHVHVFSGVPNYDLPGLYAGAEALVFVSLYEGFGLPILEAMACGCPVITARNSSLPEVAGNAALYVDEFSEHDIAAKMLSVVQDKKLKKALVKKGYKQAKKFSWEKTAKETLAVLSKVAK